MIEKCVHIKKSVVDETLQSPSTQGKHNLEPFNTISKEGKLPITILEDKEFVGGVEIHRHEGDYWLCLEGEVTFICGGTVPDAKVKINKDGTVNDLEIRGTDIKDGNEYVLHAGDWLWIPPGQPHLHKTDKTARLAVVKIPATEHVPLEEIL